LSTVQLRSTRIASDSYAETRDSCGQGVDYRESLGGVVSSIHCDRQSRPTHGGPTTEPPVGAGSRHFDIEQEVGERRRTSVLKRLSRMATAL